MASVDGYSWTPNEGLKAGIPCIGTVEPQTNIDNGSSHAYDVIVVGAGYCGLTASRDSSVAGLKVLLLEGRDRIGGRSWSSDIGGYPFEMGGTWIHWGQAHVWREIMRYQLQDEIKVSYDFSKGRNQYVQASSHGTQAFSHEEEEALTDSGLRKFFNKDGQYGKWVMPFPHSAAFTPEALTYDNMSAADRLLEIKDSLTPSERLSVETVILTWSGGTLDTVSFLEALHWWALGDYSYEGCVNRLAKYKFKRGQSAFAKLFFQEGLATSNLSYAFRSPVANVKDMENGVTVTTDNGQQYRARKMISTVPLNVLNTISFDPPLLRGKKAAVNTGHVNQIIKVHAEVRDKDLRSYTGISYPHNRLFTGFGDGTTEAGNTHIVSFGGQHNHFHPEEDIHQTTNALQGLVPMNIERLVFHNWSKDEFDKGGWYCLSH
ncbi:Monoamine oxidase N [Aspergillus sp. HF37]|nr:Monoamine oxidase N [Aspergillus sp. HF37]